LPRCEYTTTLVALGRAPIALIPAERVPITAILVVTAEIVFLAAIRIVEDDTFIRDDAEIMIQDWGHNTLLASDADEALSLLRSSQQIDALFTDIYLKRAVLGGYELAHQVIKLRLNLRVLYAAGNTINDKAKACLLTARTSFRSHTRDFSSKTPLKCCSQRSFESA